MRRIGLPVLCELIAATAPASAAQAFRFAATTDASASARDLRASDALRRDDGDAVAVHAVTPN